MGKNYNCSMLLFVFLFDYLKVCSYLYNKGCGCKYVLLGILILNAIAIEKRYTENIYYSFRRHSNAN